MPFSFYVLLVASLASRWVSTVKQSRAEFFLKVTQQQLIKVPFENFSASFTIVDVLQLLKTFFFNSVTSVGDSMEILYALQKVEK